MPIPEDPSGQFAELLRQWMQGDEKAPRKLALLVYQELELVAHHCLVRRESRDTIGDRDWAGARVRLHRQISGTA
jgi:hypothetical protein